MIFLSLILLSMKVKPAFMCLLLTCSFLVSWIIYALLFNIHRSRDYNHYYIIQENAKYIDFVSNTTGNKYDTTIDFTHKIKNYSLKRKAGCLDKPLLTMFTSFKNAPDRYQIHINSIKNWASFQPYVTPVLFDLKTDENLIKIAQKLGWCVLPVPRSGHSTPYLKDMYEIAALKFNSTFYGFSNGDLLFDYGLINTLQAVTGCLNELQKALVIGRRTNFKLQVEDIFKPNKIKQKALLNGTLFQHDAEDFFLIANNDFVWDKIPNVVIGRPGYDNFLVAVAWRSGIPVIDASETLLALHQSGKDGDFAGHQNVDNTVNWEAIGDFNFADGITLKAPFETVTNKRGEIEVWHRVTKGDPRLYKVNQNYVHLC